MANSALAVLLPILALALSIVLSGVLMRPLSGGLWVFVPCLLAAWLLVAVERRDWILNNRIAISVGVLSYSLYLWQQVFTIGKAPSLFGLFGLFLCAAHSYVLVESPMIEIGKRNTEGSWIK